MVVQVDDPDLVVLLVLDHHVVGRLEDLEQRRERERHHRRAARDEAQAALAIAPVVVVVGALRERLPQAIGQPRQRRSRIGRDLPGGSGDQRCPSAQRPRLHPDLAELDRQRGLRLRQRIDAPLDGAPLQLRQFFGRMEFAFAVLFRPLQRR